MSIKPGDMVRFVKNPRVSSHIIPVNERPIGLVIRVITRLIGDDPETQSYMKFVEVFWADKRWNHASGLSEEYDGDLEVI